MAEYTDAVRAAAQRLRNHLNYQIVREDLGRHAADDIQTVVDAILATPRHEDPCDDIRLCAETEVPRG